MKSISFVSAIGFLLLAVSCQQQTPQQANCDDKKSTAAACCATDSALLAKHLHTAPLSADSALAELKAGNLRYVNNQEEAYKLLAAERRATAQKQSPIAIVVSCSDSRVPCEEIFDLGVGEIFVVRSAGQVLDRSALGSIEYAAEHLGVKLLVVLGHERCGAVTAASKGGEAEGNIAYLVEKIKPAVDAAKTQQGDLVANAINENAKLIANEIATNEPILKELVEKGELKVVSALYDLDEGTVVYQ
jgi:carbonic anhydrase